MSILLMIGALFLVSLGIVKLGHKLGFKFFHR